MHAAAVRGAELFDVFAKRRHRAPVPFDPIDGRCAAAGRLKTQYATSGKEIEHPTPRKVAQEMPHPVEKRSAHAVGRGTKSHGVGHGERALPPHPRRNPHDARSP